MVFHKTVCLWVIWTGPNGINTQLLVEQLREPGCKVGALVHDNLIMDQPGKELNKCSKYFGSGDCAQRESFRVLGRIVTNDQNVLVAHIASLQESHYIHGNPLEWSGDHW